MDSRARGRERRERRARVGRPPAAAARRSRGRGAQRRARGARARRDRERRAGRTTASCSPPARRCCSTPTARPTRPASASASASRAWSGPSPGPATPARSSRASTAAIDALSGRCAKATTAPCWRSSTRQRGRGGARRTRRARRRAAPTLRAARVSRTDWRSCSGLCAFGVQPSVRQPLGLLLELRRRQVGHQQDRRRRPALADLATRSAGSGTSGSRRSSSRMSASRSASARERLVAAAGRRDDLHVAVLLEHVRRKNLTALASSQTATRIVALMGDGRLSDRRPSSRWRAGTRPRRRVGGRCVDVRLRVELAHDRRRQQRADGVDRRRRASARARRAPRWLMTGATCCLANTPSDRAAACSGRRRAGCRS